MQLCWETQQQQGQENVYKGSSQNLDVQRLEICSNKNVLATDQTGAALASGTFGKLSWRRLIYQQIMLRQMKIITIMKMIMKIIMTVYKVDLKYLKQ